MAIVGSVLARWPRELALFSEQLDAIGSTRSMSEVEPAGWKVALNKGIGIVVAVIGVVVIVSGVVDVV